MPKKPTESQLDFQQKFDQAKLEHRNGHVKQARAAYKELLKLQPDNPEVLYAKAVALYQLDKLDDALPFMKRALEASPENPEYLNFMGLLKRNMRQFEKALEYYEQALALAPHFFEVWNNIGLVYLDLKKREKAEGYFLKALKHAPDSPEIILNLAHVQRDLGKTEEALENYRKIVEIIPDDYRHLLNLAVCLHTLERYDEALVVIKQILKIKPDQVAAKHLKMALEGATSNGLVPDGYVEDLFDYYAKDFDEHLAALQYKVPAMFAARIPMVVAPKTKSGDWDMLDLGCGTGMCGRYFEGHCKTIVGVDVSHTMLEVAAEHGVYTDLVHQEIDDYFAQTDKTFDLITAGDVFVYMGPLEGVFEQVSKHLKKGGLFAFSTEIPDPKTEGNVDHLLRKSGRFAQSDNYILSLGQKVGLMKMINADITVRMGHNEPIPGKLYIFKK